MLLDTRQIKRTKLYAALLCASASLRAVRARAEQENRASRMAHLFCKVMLWVDKVRLIQGGTCAYPVTQAQLKPETPGQVAQQCLSSSACPSCR